MTDRKIKKVHPPSLEDFGYTLGKTIGSGAYSTVKAAWDSKQKRLIAMKIVNKVEHKERFFSREIAILARLEHEHIIETYAIIEAKDVCYIAMEMAFYGDLQYYITQRKFLSESEARGVFIQICQGVSYCHDHDIAHRDLKCENIMLDKNMHAKIADFGFSIDESIEVASTYCGSKFYCAPEIRQKNPYDAQQADIWSLGILLFNMLAGELPSHATNIDFPAKIPFDAKVFVKIMLRENPFDRPEVNLLMAGPWLQVPLITKLKPLAIGPKYTKANCNLKRPGISGFMDEICDKLPPATVISAVLASILVVAIFYFWIYQE